MMFRRSVVAAWFVAACLAAHAHPTVDATDPSLIHQSIQYPLSAVAAGEEGTVLVRAEVDAGGRVVDASIEKSSGHPTLDAAALRSISGWSYSPATRDGKAIAQWVRVPILFQLKHENSEESDVLESPSPVASVLLRALGSLIWVVGFFWSVVLAKRQSILWLSGMVALWIVTYPIFVAMHWSAAKRSLLVVSIGIVLLGLGRYLAPLNASGRRQLSFPIGHRLRADLSFAGLPCDFSRAHPGDGRTGSAMTACRQSGWRPGSSYPESRSGERSGR